MEQNGKKTTWLIVIIFALAGLCVAICFWRCQPCDDQKLVDELKALKSENVQLKEQADEIKHSFGLEKNNTSALTRKYDFTRAKKSRKEYFKNYNRMGTYDSNQQDTVLKGFYLDLDSMPEYLTAKKLYLMVGMRPKPKPSTEFGPFFSLFVFGLKANGDIIMDTQATPEPVVYEYLNPCPPRCPKSLEILLDN